jgi:UDP-N-acetyl-D-mannosaminuronate dehydrogenase
LGSGYVGLPTAALFADAGFHVTAVDIRAEVVKAINSGLTSINKPELKELISRNVDAGRLRASLNSDENLNQADAVIISVQTPIYKNKTQNAKNNKTRTLTSKIFSAHREQCILRRWNSKQTLTSHKRPRKKPCC